MEKLIKSENTRIEPIVFHNYFDAEMTLRTFDLIKIYLREGYTLYRAVEEDDGELVLLMEGRHTSFIVSSNPLSPYYVKNINKYKGTILKLKQL